jgi:hypothetical protein
MFRSISQKVALLSLLVSTTCLSTTYAQQRFSVGPRVGLNLSTLRGDVTGYKLTPGLAAGAFVMYSSLNHFGISADVLYSQRGGRFPSTTNGGTTTEFTQRINYLEIPVALRYFLTRSGDFRPNVFFGPSLAIPLSAQRVRQKLNNVEQPNTDNSSTFKNLDLGLLAGFQLNFPGFGERQRFLIDARYTFGLTDITVPFTPVNVVPGANGAQNIYNSTITVTLGYGFGVGREHPSRYRR